MKINILCLCVAGLALVAVERAVAAPKNVILMISDGRSYAAVDAARFWRGSAPLYEGKNWNRYFMSTYSASNDAAKNPKGYDPARVWDNDGVAGYRPNQEYLKSNATDSASGITAIVTGQKNRDGQINWSIDDKPLITFAQIYNAAGRATGAISTVNWSHATPAGIGSHNASRNNYVDIATEMLTKSGLDVIMGAGNPNFDNDGKPVATATYSNVGEANWKGLVDGSSGFKLIQTREEFAAMGTGASTPARVCGTFEALSTAQQGRAGYKATDLPGSIPLNANIPTMSEMALAALNVLDNNKKGFFVMMEGGAIDWAAHANQSARLIEEHLDFDKAVEAVSGWVEANSNWEDTLVIITSDHGNGMITGPNGETSIRNNGKGVMPGMKFNHTSHVNELVPLYARGAGSGLFKRFDRGNDPVREKYCDNTDIFRVMVQATGMRLAP